MITRLTLYNLKNSDYFTFSEFLEEKQASLGGSRAKWSMFTYNNGSTAANFLTTMKLYYYKVKIIDIWYFG